jgi:transposase
MARRRFSKEYKQEAVSLVQQSDNPVAEIARNLGINDNMLRRWVKEHADPVRRSFPGHGNPRDEEPSISLYPTEPSSHPTQIRVSAGTSWHSESKTGNWG